jgi:hypothetical protein
MSMMAQPADSDIQQQANWLRQQWERFVSLLRLLTGYYLLYRLELWRERPDIRRKVLINIASLWGYAWIAVSALVIMGWRYNYLLPMFSVLGVVFVFLLFFIAQGHDQSALTLAASMTAVFVFWLVMVNLPVFIYRGVDVHAAPLLMLFGSQLGAYLPYAIWGLVWIVFIYIVMLSMPVWVIKINYGEVYLVEDSHIYPEGFRLDSRPSPKVDRSVIDALVAGGIPKDLIDTFIRFNGPVYMRQTLVDKMGKEPDVVTQRNLELLFAQAADRSHTAPPILWVSALDNERLIWDRKRSVPVTVLIDQLVTKDGHPVKIELEFKCSFDPESIRSPEFRLGLKSIRSTDDMARRVEDVMRAGAISAARLYFVRLPLRDALTQGAVEDFRRDFPGLMAGFQSLGIVINPSSVSCRPVIDPEVQFEETRMLASRARALSETAKLQALIDKVILQGVPPDLLAGLLFLDQSTSGSNKAFQISSDTDVLPLPEASNQQQARYLYHKFRGDVPREAIPELPTGDIRVLPAGDDDQQDGAAPPADQRDWSQRGDRFTSNIGDQKKRRE